MKRCSVVTLAALLLAVTAQTASAGAQAAGARPPSSDQSRRGDAMVLMSAAVLARISHKPRGLRRVQATAPLGAARKA